MPAFASAVFWALATLGIYAASRAHHQRHPRWWSSPLLVTWVGCGALIIALHATYRDYLGGTGWLALLLGPATVAFAVPIHRHRDLIRRRWPILAAGVVAGSGLAVLTSWLLASWFGFPPELRASLLPRSVTTPLAMIASREIGGRPEITASLTAITGLFGAAVGELILHRLPFRSAYATGAMFGMGAHGAGVAKARELGQEEGAVAGLIMILAGLFNVIAAAALTSWLRGGG
jgi:putative effector of murein hydrolase